MSNAAASQLMNQLILDFPQHMRTALALATKVELERPEVDYKNVLILGMGGSGIGGVLVKNWIADDIAVPVQVANDYQIPAYVDQDTLVIASSYSGNTEETLMALGEALERNSVKKMVSRCLLCLEEIRQELLWATLWQHYVLFLKS